MTTVIAWFLIALGLLVTSVGAMRLIGVGGFKRAQATSTGGGSFRFTTHDGHETIATAQPGSGPLPPAGSTLQVYYPVDQPHAARVENLMKRVFVWMIAGDALAIGGVLALVA